MRRGVCWLVVVGIGCSKVPISIDPTPEDYCRERDKAWVRGFPDDAKQYPAFADNKSCPEVIRREQAAEPEFWKKRVRCMREHIRTDQEGDAATKAYTAMAHCESGGPQPAK